MDVRTGDRVQLRSRCDQWWDVVNVLDVRGVVSVAVVAVEIVPGETSALVVPIDDVEQVEPVQ